MKTTVVWLGRDLRLADNPALREASREGAVAPVFIWSPEEDGAWAPGAASRWWLHRSLERLERDLAARGSRLTIKIGPAAAALAEAARETGATAVAYNRVWEPAALAREKTVPGLRVHAGNVLFTPDEVRTQIGGPYRVFTPYWSRCGALPPPPPPVGDPGPLRAPAKPARGVPLAALDLLPKRDWAEGLAESFEPGEAGATKALRTFLRGPARDYAANRNLPASAAGSRLSPRLAFGELSIHRVWKEASGGDPGEKGGFLSELGWREFGRHVLRHQPETPHSPLDPRFARFPWRRDPEGLQAWKKGLTGYPMVDAGMRELWRTGFMHNRLRMVVASFLCKHLLIDWREGAAWFWDTLVDADLANNTLGWQWTAGCGADAAPYYRIFNPIEQGKRYDPDGAYVRRWVPELARLPERWLHAPWTAPPEALEKAGVTLGREYPAPIVDHAAARARALDAFGATAGVSR